MAKTCFAHEFRRRNMPRAAVLYATSVWALAQGIASLGPVVNAPDWATRWFLIAALIGFPFWLAFAWFYELTPQGFKRESEVAPDASVARATGRRLDVWIMGALTVAVVLLLADRFVTRRQDGAAIIAEKSIAVLPLANESGDPGALYFSDGLSEDMITALSQFSGLKVIGRNSAFKFRNSTEASNVIGEKLGVAHLLEGSVRRVGDVVRISAELIDAADGSTLWSEHYDRPYKDLFQLQDDITNAVAGALKAKLLGAGTPAAAPRDRPPSGNLAAYNAYLMGRFYNNSRINEADARKAIDAFTTATSLDPRYANAWAGLSIAWTNLTGYLSGAPAQHAFAQARAAADTSLALAPNLANAHLARGTVLENADSDLTGAEAEYRRAVQLAPNEDAAKFDLGFVLAKLGHIHQAIMRTQEALAIDPLDASAHYQVASFLLSLGRFDEAKRAIRAAIELQPDGTSFQAELAVAEILRGDADAALAAARLEPPGPWRDVAVALAQQIGGNPPGADAALKNLIDKHGDDAPFQIAEAYALRRNPGKTFEWLDRAWALHDGGVLLLLYDPFILRYRDDPRFTAFCRKVGLPSATDATIGADGQ
jgi:TolB-like protein/Flp pilus assembly protein TadD